MSNLVVAAAFGGPEVLTVIQETVGEPGPGQVRIDVRAAGVNPVDWKIYGGVMGVDASRLPLRLGFEAAGVVTAVGPDAIGPAGPVSAGDEVVVYSVSGAYAEQLVVDVSLVIPKPPSLSWEQSAGLLLTGTTAVHALTSTRVDAGDTVLVHGAAGGVGLMLVQLAVVRGARVIGTASESHHAQLRDFGAEPVTYGDGLADRVRALAPDGVTAAIDAVGSDEAVDVSLELVADRSRIATIAAFRRAKEAGIALLGGGPGADPGTEIRAAARFELGRLADSGALTVKVASVFPLVQAGEAHRLGQSGHVSGKIVLVP